MARDKHGHKTSRTSTIHHNIVCTIIHANIICTNNNVCANISLKLGTDIGTIIGKNVWERWSNRVHLL